MRIVLSGHTGGIGSAIYDRLTVRGHEVLGVSLPTVYRLLARGILRPLPGLRHKRLPKKQVHGFVEGVRPVRW